LLRSLRSLRADRALEASLARSQRYCEVMTVSGGWLLARPSRQRRARSDL